MEKAGIPVAQVTAMTPVAKAVGSNRIIQAKGIVYPLGDPELPANEEKDLRRRIVQQALDALATEGRTTP
ncbi:MAG: glycine/betaine/sarcosine/D-proline family reductase selenoprotein B [Chloroflexi bacterium]|nr:glycine/betaine/sarcosine/D-proline family reductase selenoprotein B [Chloroflexota bacterium]MCI0879529.1 glycine/betaine/sarcosine/D-proline family reductase selenoprotein B [Chloroflexota bacterium]